MAPQKRKAQAQSSKITKTTQTAPAQSASQKVQKTQKQAASVKKEVESVPELARENQNLEEGNQKAVGSSQEMVKQDDFQKHGQAVDDDSDAAYSEDSDDREDRERAEREEDDARRTEEQFPAAQAQYRKRAVKEMEREGWGYHDSDSDFSGFDSDEFKEELDRRLTKWGSRWSPELDDAANQYWRDD